MSINLKGSSDYSEISALLGELIAIESVNMDYKGSANGEAKIADYVYKYLKTLGVNCVKEEVLPNRYNVICYIEGKDKRGICFESHMDTVSINNMTIEPLNPIIKEGKMFGRGSADDKGSLASMMYAIKILTKNNLNPSAMSAVARGKVRHHYGYKCKKLTNIKNVKYDYNEWESKGKPGGLNYGSKNGWSKKVKIEEVIYDCMREASEKTGLSLHIIRKNGDFNV